MPTAETVRFAALTANILAESLHSPEGPNALLVSSRVRVRYGGRAGPVSMRMLDAASRVVLEEISLGPDGAGALQLGLYAFEPPSDRDFVIQLVNPGGSVSGYLTIVHPVTPDTLAALRSSRDAPLTIPEGIGNEPTRSRARELAPIAAGGGIVRATQLGNRDIEPIFHRRSNTSDFVSGVVPARNRELQVIHL